jgi:hypothetical protein
MIKTAAPTREDVTDALDASLREIASGDIGDAKTVQIAAQHMLVPRHSDFYSLAMSG